MPFDLNTLNHLFGYIDLKNKCLTTLTVIIVVISLRFIYKRYFSDQQHFRKMLKSASKHSATKGFDENWNDIVVDEPTNVNYDRQSAVDVSDQSVVYFPLIQLTTTAGQFGTQITIPGRWLQTDDSSVWRRSDYSWILGTWLSFEWFV